MLKRPITYTNNDGVTVTKNFYFDLEVDELAILELNWPGGLSKYWIKLIEDRDAGKMLVSFKELIAAAYGERDGEDFFLKETESGYPLGRRFLQHRAYHALFMELLGEQSDDDAFSKFLKAIVPPELAARMDENPNITAAELAALSNAPSDARVQDDVPVFDPSTAKIESDSDLEPAPKDEYNRQDLLAMSQEDFDKEFGTDPSKWDKVVLQVAFQRKNQN